MENLLPFKLLFFFNLTCKYIQEDDWTIFLLKKNANIVRQPSLLVFLTKSKKRVWDIGSCCSCWVSMWGSNWRRRLRFFLPQLCASKYRSCLFIWLCCKNCEKQTENVNIVPFRRSDKYCCKCRYCSVLLQFWRSSLEKEHVTQVSYVCKSIPIV